MTTDTKWSVRAGIVKSALGLIVGVCAAFIFLAWQIHPAMAATCTFSRTVSDDWNTATNWDCGGGYGTGRVPLATDDATIDATSTVVSATSYAKTVTIVNGGSLSLGANTLHVNGDWVHANFDGTFDPGTSTVIFEGTADQAISEENMNFYNVTINKPSGIATINRAGMDGALYVSSNSHLTITGRIDAQTTALVDLGSVVTSTGNVQLWGEVTNRGSLMVPPDADPSAGFTFNASTTNTGLINAGSGALHFLDLFHNYGTLNGGLGVVEFKKLVSPSGTFIPGTSEVQFTGTVSQDLPYDLFYKLTIKQSSGTITMVRNATTTNNFSLSGSGGGPVGVAGVLRSKTVRIAIDGGPGGSTQVFSVGAHSLAVVGTVTISAGTLNLGTGRMFVGGNWLRDTGSFSGQSGLVRFNKAGDQVIAENGPFGNLEIYNTGGTATLFASTSSTGDFVVAPNSAFALNGVGPTGSTYTAFGPNYTNHGLVTLGEGGKIIHAFDSVQVTDSSGTPVTSITSPGSFYFTVVDKDWNLNGAVVETASVSVVANAAAGSDSETLTLTETSADSGIFRNATALAVIRDRVTTGDHILEIADAGIGTGTYTDTQDTADTGSGSVNLLVPTAVTRNGGGGGGYYSLPVTTNYQSGTNDPDRDQNLLNLIQINVKPNDLVKLQDDGNLNTQEDSAVYYIGADGKRHAFPNSGIYFSWYKDFSNVQIISLDKLASIPLGKNVRYKPGSVMLKFTTDPKTYLVTSGGIMRWIKTEAIAKTLYGADWNKFIVDLNDTQFASYTIGEPINAATDVDLAAIKASVLTISDDLHL
ncbi:MAG: hypothetical protein PHC53_01660 [Patescibacteria group bacterium]|nr:hypothetical protein [Patescibacteria group bacterium]